MVRRKLSRAPGVPALRHTTSLLRKPDVPVAHAQEVGLAGHQNGFSTGTTMCRRSDSGPTTSFLRPTLTDRPQ